jgi:hypothetical protein
MYKENQNKLLRFQWWRNITGVKFACYPLHACFFYIFWFWVQALSSPRNCSSNVVKTKRLYSHEEIFKIMQILIFINRY